VINITIAIYRFSTGTYVRALQGSGALRDWKGQGEYLDYVARLLRDGFYITGVAIGCEGIIIRTPYLPRTS
jgi:hypothetical protein